MKSFFAMRRANGDWFAVDDNGHVRMPIFKSSGDAMIARSRDSGMECFRPVAFDAPALELHDRLIDDADVALLDHAPDRCSGGRDGWKSRLGHGERKFYSPTACTGLAVGAECLPDKACQG